jgi:hypothetical protein
VKTNAVALGLLAIILFACSQQTIPMPSLDSRFSEFQIIYFADAETTGFLSPNYVSSSLGSKVEYSWPDVVDAAAADYPNAILIHRDVVEQVDMESLIKFYDNATTLVFFDLWAPQIGDLVKDQQLSSDRWMDGSEPMGGDFYVIVWHKIECTNGELAQGRPRYCPGGSMLSSSSLSRSAESLAVAEDFSNFREVLFLQLQTNY